MDVPPMYSEQKCSPAAFEKFRQSAQQQ